MGKGEESLVAEKEELAIGAGMVGVVGGRGGKLREEEVSMDAVGGGAPMPLLLLLLLCVNKGHTPYTFVPYTCAYKGAQERSFGGCSALLASLACSPRVLGRSFSGQIR